MQFAAFFRALTFSGLYSPSILGGWHRGSHEGSLNAPHTCPGMLAMGILTWIGPNDHIRLEDPTIHSFWNPPYVGPSNQNVGILVFMCSLGSLSGFPNFRSSESGH